MITSALITIFGWFFYTLLFTWDKILDVLSLGIADKIADYISSFALIVPEYFRVYVWRWNGLFPVDTAMFFFVFAIELSLMIFGFRITMWVYSLVRGRGQINIYQR